MLFQQINDSFKKFGILDSTKDILAVMMTQENAIGKVQKFLILKNRLLLNHIVLHNKWHHRKGLLDNI